jgi:hypothetical protein
MPDDGRIGTLISQGKLDWVAANLGVTIAVSAATVGGVSNARASTAGPAQAEPVAAGGLDADHLKGFALMYVGKRWAEMAQETKVTYTNLNKRLREKMPAWQDPADPVFLEIADTQIREAGLQPGVVQANAEAELDKRKKKIDDALTKAMLGPINTALDTIRVDDKACREILAECGHSWKKVKAKYLNDPTVMWELFQFRKKWVNGTLARLNAESGGELVAKSVGSNNLSSDYDITLSTKSGTGAEIPAIKKFNAACKSEFGVPPGFLFDTNLYAKDFLKVDDNLLATGGEKVSDEGVIAGVEEFTAEDQSDQDVGALTKQRQYLGADAWERYKNGVIAKIGDAGQKKAATAQFEEAETLYITKVKAKTDPLIAVLQGLPKKWDMEAEKNHASAKDRKHLEELVEELDSLVARYQVVASDLRESAHLETVADEIAHFVHEHAEAEMLEVNNDVYLDKMTEVRKIQDEHKTVDAALKEFGKPEFVEALKKSPKDYAEAAKIAQSGGDVGKKVKEYLEGRSHGLKARAKKEVAEANFFASEAYLSEGPLQHIVAAIQSGSPEVLAKMKPEHFLGSVNEQFGDYMKDIGHYANPGEAFCQTSKYIERLLDAIALLRGKEAFAGVALGVLPAAELGTLKANITKELLPIRGGKKDYADMSDEERFRIALEKATTVYGTAKPSDLTAKLLAYTTAVNADVRALMSMRPNAAEIGAYAQKSKAA